MKRHWICGVLAFAVAAMPAVAQPPFTIFAGDDALVTTSGTHVDLKRFPIEKVFGASIDSDPIVKLRGRSLGPQAALQGVDTIVRRPQNVTVSANGASTPLVIMGLRLESETPVVIGGREYSLEVFLSEFRTDVITGSLRLSAMNEDGGTFSSEFRVRPRLVFTGKEGDGVVIDCGAVDCGDDLVLTANNVFTRGGGNFDPRGIRALPAGIPVDGDGNGSPDFITRASTNFFIGIQPFSPFVPNPVPKEEESSGVHNVAVATSAAVNSASASSKQ